MATASVNCARRARMRTASRESAARSSLVRTRATASPSPRQLHRRPAHLAAPDSGHTLPRRGLGPLPARRRSRLVADHRRRAQPGFGARRLSRQARHAQSRGAVLRPRRIRRRVDAFADARRNWRLIGLEAFGAPVSVDAVAPPYGGTRQLITSAAPNPDATRAGGSPEHGATVVDRATPLLPDGTPRFAPVWAYMAFPD